MNEPAPTRGVPSTEILAKDFIIVRAALIQRLGGANEAIVWARIHYRCDEDSKAAYEVLTGRWWAATYDVLAAETGLSSKQVRTALERLVAGGFLRAEQHRIRSNYDQTYSYQTVVDEGQIHLPQRADEGAQEGNSHLPQRADVPLIETLKTEVQDVNPQTPITLDIDIQQPPTVDELFEQFWAAWPRKEAKKTARRAYDKALAAARRDFGPGAPDEQVAGRILVAVERWADQWLQVEGRTPEKIPHPSTWLNGERWNDQLPAQRPGIPGAAIAGRQLTKREQNLAFLHQVEQREQQAVEQPKGINA